MKTRLITAVCSMVLATMPALSQNALLDDPLPIRRVLLPSKSADILKGQAGEFVILRRTEFEAQVQEAAKHAAAGTKEPRLIQAHYRAKFSEDTLIDGQGTWKVFSPASSSLLIIPKLNLALTKFEGGDAVLGEFGNQTGLVTAGSGTQDVTFNWTLRGKARAGGTEFEIHAPPCLSSILEIIVPAGQELLVPPTSLLVPNPTNEAASHRTWRIHFTEASPLRLSVRRPALTASANTSLLTQVITRQQLFPGSCISEHLFSWESAPPGRDELILDCSDTLMLIDVTSSDIPIDGWQLRPAQGSQPASLVVRFKKPAATGGILLRCVSDIPSDGQWVSPILHPRDGVLSQERLDLTVSPALQIENFSPGDFRIAANQTDERARQVITLMGGDARVRPKAKLKPSGPRGFADQKTLWTINPIGSTLVSDLTLHATAGKSFQLSFLLPKSTRPWQVETVELSPKGTLRAWTVVGQTLLLDLASPLDAGESASAKLTLTSKHIGSHDSQEVVLDFPDVDPGPTFARRGSLEIRLADIKEANLLQSSSSPDPISAETPGFIFHHRGQAPTGRIRLLPTVPLQTAPTEELAKKVDASSKSTAIVSAKRPPTLSEACLRTSPGAGASMTHQFEVVIIDWPEFDFPVTLPASTSEISTVSVNDLWVDRCRIERTDDGLLLRIPMAEGEPRNRVEIRYQTKTTIRKLAPWAVIDSDPPVTPIPIPSMRRLWQISHGWEPLSALQKVNRRQEASVVANVWQSADSLLSGKFKPAVPKERAGTEWEQKDGPGRIVIVNRTILRWFGMLLACGVLGVVLRLPLLVRNVPAYLCFLLALGLGVIWLPRPLREIALWPMLVLLGIGVFSYAAALVRSRQAESQGPPTQRIAKTVLTGSLIVLATWLAPGSSVSQEQTPQVVYILGDPLDVETQTVLAPPDLMKRLDGLKTSSANPPGPVITSAQYTGKVANKTAIFRAEFKIHTFAGKTELSLPLLDVDLEEGARLDGEAAYPSPRAGGGYTLPIADKGSHTLVIPFKVRLWDQGESRALRFGIPKVCSAHLQIALPPNAKLGRILSGHGQSRLDADILSADLGGDHAAHALWSHRDGDSADFNVSEVYLWELQTTANLLTAKYRTSGAHPISKLTLHVPDQYELRRLEVKRDGTNGAGLPIRTEYSRADGRYEIILTEPAAEPVEMSVQLLDPAPMSLKPKTTFATRTFRFPHLDGAKTTLGLMAVRSSGMHHVIQGQGVALTPVSREAFDKHWHETDGAGSASFYSFRRAGATPALTATLSPATRKAETSLTWQVDSQHSDLSADIRFTSAEIDMNLVEVDAPESVVVADITGPHVRSWARSDSTIQVWLSEPVKDTTLTISGWTKNVLRAIPPKEGRFALPLIRVLNAPSTTKVRVRAAAGISLDILTSKQLTKSDSTDTIFVATTPNYEATFRVRAGAPVLQFTKPSIPGEQADSSKAAETKTEPNAQPIISEPPPQLVPGRQPISPETADNEVALIATAVFALSLLAVWLLSLAPSLLNWLGLFWPEQILAIAVVGWLCLGPSLLGGLLAGAAIAARVLIAFRAIGPASKAAEPASSVSSSS